MFIQVLNPSHVFKGMYDGELVQIPHLFNGPDDVEDVVFFQRFGVLITVYKPSVIDVTKPLIV